MSSFLKRLLARSKPAAIARTYATWNPSDKGGGVVLANGNLKVSLVTTPADGGSVRSTIGKSSGKWYWEITALTSWALPGIATSLAPVGASNYYANGNYGHGYYGSNGILYGTKAQSWTTAPYGGGSVIGMALDMDAGTLRIYKNGIDLGIAFAGLSGIYFAAEGNYTLNQDLSTANFGATAFVYPVPSGFNAGLYTEGPVAYTAWNPSDKSANLTLSNGNLSIATTNPGGMVRSALGKASGKWYWEVTKNGGPDLVVGVAKAGANLSAYLGSDVNGYGYISSNGAKVTGGGTTGYGSTYTNGDVIGVALDLDAGTLTFYKNGVSQGVAFTGLSGMIHAAEGTTNTGDACTANFGATPFVYSPPSGFSAGLFA